MLNVGQLVAEKERLEGVLVDATDAKKDIKALDMFLERFGNNPSRVQEPEAGVLFCQLGECASDPRSYRTAAGLRIHQEQRHGVFRVAPNTKCTEPGCNRKFRGKTGLATHLTRKHGKGAS